MERSGIAPSNEFLSDAASTYFVDRFERPKILTASQIDPSLGWRPSLHFKADNHVTIAVEASEHPYPKLLRLRYAEILDIQIPIAVYSVCPDEAYLGQDGQREAKELQAHGFGLLTVDNIGAATLRFPCIPLMQHIPKKEFDQAIDGLPKRLRIRLKDAYDSYNHNAVSGLQNISEILEALVVEVAGKAAKRNWIDSSVTKSSIANVLDFLSDTKQMKNSLAAIGGVRSHMKQYRNVAHHAPRSAKKAFEKYTQCHHGFRDGLRQAKNFYDSMKLIGMTLHG